MNETRKHLKGLTKYVIGHLEALLEKYGPQYPRLTTKSSRHEEVDAKAVAFKAFKVAYDRESGYVGYKVSGEEFKLECTKFDKLLLVFKDGTYKVTRAAGKIVCRAGIVLLRPAGSGTGFHLRLHRPQRELSEAVHIWRHDHEQGISLHSGQIAHPVLRAGHAENLYIRYKPAPHQKINQQTCEPKEVEVKAPKTRGRQISIKDISSVTAEPTRGWDEKAPASPLKFA